MSVRGVSRREVLQHETVRQIDDRAFSTSTPGGQHVQVSSNRRA